MINDYLGLRMVDQSGSEAGKGLKSHLLTFLLIMVKSLVLPLVTREIVSQVNFFIVCLYVDYKSQMFGPTLGHPRKFHWFESGMRICIDRIYCLVSN